MGFVEEHFPEDVVVDLHAHDGDRRLLVVALAHHDGVSGGDRGLPLPNVKGNGVDKGLGIDLVVVHGSLVPGLIRGLIVDVGEVTARKGHFSRGATVVLYMFSPVAKHKLTVL